MSDRWCQICDHTIETVEECNIAGCDSYGKPHSHCLEDCFCTYGGCMPNGDFER